MDELEMRVGYAEQNLISGEAIQYKGRLHWVAMIKRIITAAVLAAIAIALIAFAFANNSEYRGALGWAAGVILIVSLLIITTAIVQRKAAEFVVTNKRVIIKIGLLHRRTIEIFLTKIESVEINQSVMGRMLNFGSIAVKGTGGTTEPFPLIAKPFEFRRQVQEQEQKQMGIGAN